MTHHEEAVAAVVAKLRGRQLRKWRGPDQARRRRQRREAAPRGGRGMPRAESVVEELGVEDREKVVKTFIRLLGGLYTHLPQKRAMYGHDPVQRLRLLQRRVGTIDAVTFHRSIAEIFTDLRDAHTRYLGPQNEGGQVAVLPFLVEAYVEEGETHFMVAKSFDGAPDHKAAFESSGFERQVEITHWNGVPIARAVDLHAEHETGGRPDARLARALESLTLRPLRYALPPDEDWVVISFIRHDGRPSEIRLEWNVVDLPDLPAAADFPGSDLGAYAANGYAGTVYAGNPAAEASRRAKKLLFAPDAWYAAETRRLTSVSRSAAAHRERGEWISGRFQDNVSARVVTTRFGELGHLRLWSFDLQDDDGFLDEVVELLGELPRNGLILDLRGNPGGLIWAAERLLQLFTPGRIEPTRFSMLATDLTRSMAAAPQALNRLEPWRRSLDAAVANGESYSSGLPLTDPRRCNDRGQLYPGPVVAIVDANTYSSGDLFAAGFVDNRVGMLISIGEATGAGGANVWFPGQVQQALAGTEYAVEDLPTGLSYTLAFRRALRVGDLAGIGIEDVGVAGHERRSFTKRDLTDGNADLLDFCGALLSTETVTDMKIAPSDRELVVTTSNLDRVDLHVDEHPSGSKTVDRTLDPTETVFELPEGWRSLEVVGLAGQIVRQRRRIGP